MPWLQLFIDTDPSKVSSMEDAALAVGAVSVTLQEYIPEGANEQPILEPPLNETPLWQRTRITALFDSSVNTQAISHKLEQLVADLPELNWQPLEDKDWERAWMDNYQPIQVADNFWICPSWCEPPNPQAVNLSLDPGLAFGTGTHPTTYLCMQWLASQNLKGKTIIDYGCGSGILGIASLLLGAEQAVGVDIDPQALVATRENLKRNQLPVERFPVFHSNTALQSADLVVANILAGPLIELAPRLLDLLKPGGYLCLSGILATQAQQVIAAYKEKIIFDLPLVREDWVCVTGEIR